eukprot:TRINITY_DN2302_c0_g1_i1.p1 TRINITY_DN2302_c0_g1~~TRINITY_DN2302_c0_g1_i1.p1  ORF type:complete len:226 (-),score=44.29 TRINITY_DN2302_c0_g1_i1:131-808(-)
MLDPCMTFVANNQSVSFVISEATTDAAKGVLAQYLDIQPLTIIQTDNSTSVPFVPSCTSFGFSDIEFCTPNAYFGLNITSATTTDNQTIAITVSFTDNYLLSHKMTQVILAGDGSCPHSYSDNDIGINYFAFPLTRANGSEATFQANLEPDQLNQLWYLYLDYSLPVTQSYIFVTVSLDVSPQVPTQPNSRHLVHGANDSNTSSMDDNTKEKHRHMVGDSITINS